MVVGSAHTENGNLTISSKKSSLLFFSLRSVFWWNLFINNLILSDRNCSRIDLLEKISKFSDYKEGFLVHCS